MGAVAGAISTAAMSALMIAARRIGWMDAQPPVEIVSRSSALLTGDAPRRDVADAMGAVGHLLFGAGGGAVFAAARSRRRRSPDLPPWLVGAMYGSGIWSVSYLGWVPALGLLPPAEDDEPHRPSTMLVAHWVYGAVLGSLLDRLLRSRTLRLEASPPSWSLRRGRELVNALLLGRNVN